MSSRHCRKAGSVLLMLGTCSEGASILSNSFFYTAQVKMKQQLPLKQLILTEEGLRGEGQTGFLSPPVGGKE